jgi:hypothetical protein
MNQRQEHEMVQMFARQLERSGIEPLEGVAVLSKTMALWLLLCGIGDRSRIDGICDAAMQSTKIMARQFPSFPPASS